MNSIPKTTKDELIKIFSQFPEIQKVVLFGSRASDKFGRNSDIDLAIFGDVDFEILAQIKNKIYYSSIPFFVDILIFNDLKNDTLRKNIEKGIVIYEKPF